MVIMIRPLYLVVLGPCLCLSTSLLQMPVTLQRQDLSPPVSLGAEEVQEAEEDPLLFEDGEQWERSDYFICRGDHQQKIEFSSQSVLQVPPAAEKTTVLEGAPTKSPTMKARLLVIY